MVRGTVEASRVIELMSEDTVRSTPSFSDFLMQIHSNIIASVYYVCERNRITSLSLNSYLIL